jgi:broad specificity phosphatase PhoE
MIMTKNSNKQVVSALSQPKVWSDYKTTLIQAGVLELQKSRPIEIKAVNIGNNAELSMRDSSKDEVKEQDDNVVTKIIHFQRHGQGYHNLLGDVLRSTGQEVNIDDPNPKTNPFVKPEIQDSPLTFQGRTEASNNRIYASMLSPQAIIVSPLVRAIQTALISFSDHINNNDDKKNVPFIAHEGCREQLGFLTCNKALPLSQTKLDYPQVDFTYVSHTDDEDPLWDQYKTRELPIDEANRAYDFLTDFVMKREEDEIAIVCHSAWLFSVCNAVIDCDGDEFLESWFNTGEIRSLKVSFVTKNK